MLSLFINFLLAINVIVCLLIILVVLMQRPKSEGLGAAFGGGMTENLFGAQTSNVLANFTRWLGGIFFLLTLILSILYAKQSTQRSSIQAAAIKAAAAAAASEAASPAAAVSGTAALSSTGNVAVPAASPAKSITPASTEATPAPAASPSAAAAAVPKAGGTTSGH